MADQGTVSALRVVPDTAHVPPHNLEAEQLVLGAMMLSAKACTQVLAVLEADHFYKEAHQRIFTAIAGLAAGGLPTDAISVLDGIGIRNLETIGGAPYLHTLVAGVAHVGAAQYHAEIVVEHARLRKLQEFAARIHQQVSDGAPTIAIRGDARADLEELDDAERITAIRPRTAAELLDDPPQTPSRLMDPSVIVAGGITSIAAPTKVGKTNLWLHVAWALTEGKDLWGRWTVAAPTNVLMLQLELSPGTLYERLHSLRVDLGWSDEALGRFTWHCERSLLLDTPQGADRIRRLIDTAQPRPDMVIIDSYNAAIAGDPDRSGDTRKALQALRKIQQATGVTLGVTSEIRKAPPGQKLSWGVDDLKGNNELAYDVDTSIMLRPLNDERTRLAVNYIAMRHGDAAEPFTLHRQGLTFTAGEMDPEASDVIIQSLLEDVLGYVEANPGASANQTFRNVAGRRGDVLAAVRHLRETGRIITKRGHDLYLADAKQEEL